jgi:hypothetical protein
MAETHPIRLSAEEIARQAARYFGPEGLGLNQVAHGPSHLRFEGAKGFVEIEIRDDTNNQSRVTIEHKGFEHEIQEFRQRLARQAQAETRASD